MLFFSKPGNTSLPMNPLFEKEVPRPKVLASPYPRICALLLSLFIFLGMGGLHRIYVGRRISGLLQLVTCGGFFIWQGMDMVRILLCLFRDKEGRILV